ncbi:MAG: transcriptional repressor LexA [Ardenticatenaceae bacterium]|nr:transcriptional repressor LexA [Anaerolineales bacterium]MCB8982232.1 transcriptional repressor LexA [Ardenticatenaceae bacterium]MCB8987022.1 transcriptional repressor LexA [Ardenticatenaceae bacterium]
MSKKPLSKRQQNILRFIYEYREEHDRPPTIREIGGAVGISSTSVVNYNLTRLEERGYLNREAEVSRGISFTDKATDFLGVVAEKVNQVATAVADSVTGLIKVPLLGDIVAGEPIEVGSGDFAVYDEDDAIEVSSAMLKGRVDDLFALRVNGESMIDAMVNDGDIVIMRKQETANNGDMVAVWLAGDTTTLKYFYYDGDRIRLQPANPTMKPIYVEPEDVRVQGKVMMVLRQTA